MHRKTKEKRGQGNSYLPSTNSTAFTPQPAFSPKGTFMKNHTPRHGVSRF